MMPTNKHRMPGRPKKSDNGDSRTREQVLRKASAVFMELGFERVSLERIARECGVTKATVYYYFDNKANLFTLSVVHTLERVRSHVRNLLEQEKNLKDKLVDIAAERMKHKHGDFETLLKEASLRLSSEQIAEIRKAELAIHLALADALQAAMERGALARENPLLLSHAFSALCMLGNSRSFLEGYATLEDAASAIVRVFWNGAAQRN
ncbi:MAG TPA: TetR/AcrR family transcriptional regulator [Bacilli bacterium]